MERDGRGYLPHRHLHLDRMMSERKVLIDFYNDCGGRFSENDERLLLKVERPLVEEEG